MQYSTREYSLLILLQLFIFEFVFNLKTLAAILNTIDKESSNSNKQKENEFTTAELNLKFAGEIILGITSHVGILAIVFTKRFALYSLDEEFEDVVYLHSIVLEPELAEVIELKFFNAHMVFFCSRNYCWSCSFGISIQYTRYNLNKNGLSENSALLVATSPSDDSITLRYATIKELSFTLKYILNKSAEIDIDKPIAEFSDGAGKGSQYSFPIAFSRGPFTYFVENILRSLDPLADTEYAGLRAPSSRISRICEDDTRINVESRIDVSLKCDSNKVFESTTALAASYDQETDELLIAFQISTENRMSVCTYKMTDIDEALRSLWNDCQNEKYNSLLEECAKVDLIEYVPSFCFVFTQRSGRRPVLSCKRVREDLSAEPYDNCEPFTFLTLANRYHWIESYAPIDGDVFARLPSSMVYIIAIHFSRDRQSVFALSSTGILHRIGRTKNQNEAILWTEKSILNTAHAFTIDVKTNMLTSVSASRDQIISMKLSCSNLYTSCYSLDNINWSDPMNCSWCLQTPLLGYAISSSHSIQCDFHKLRGVCLPIIVHVNLVADKIDSKIYDISGLGFNRVMRPRITICNENCAPNKIESEKIVCTSSVRMLSYQLCEISIVAFVNGFGYYNFSYIHKNSEQPAEVGLNIAWNTRTIKVVVSIVAICVLGSLIIIAFWLLNPFKKRNSGKKFSHGSDSQANITMINGPIYAHVDNNAYAGDYSLGPLFNSTHHQYRTIFMEVDSAFKISQSNLTLQHEIGKGNFGIVYKGTYREKNGKLKDVACKTVVFQQFSFGVTEFIREGLIMAKFDHPNVAGLIGISMTDNYCPIIVTDYMQNGDLRNYILNFENKITFRNLLSFAAQIAAGVEYLHGLKFIHRDLAARNCMMDTNFNVKVADFGLCRDVSACGMYEVVHTSRGIPVRWMPIESLEEQQFTFKADVWAYGIVLWELATRGLIPYGELDSIEILRLLKNGHRLSQPKGCPDILYKNVMLVCWVEDPQRRPSFHELKIMIEDVVVQLQRGVTGTTLLNNHYERVSPKSVGMCAVNTAKRNSYVSDVSHL